jgi:hypothetical protein
VIDDARIGALQFAGYPAPEALRAKNVRGAFGTFLGRRLPAQAQLATSVNEANRLAWVVAGAIDAKSLKDVNVITE